MSMEGVFQITLILATLLCSLVAGFVFAFAVVVMPGIKTLSDRDFIRAFQVMDRVIQNNQPLFIFVWVGSIVALVIAVVFGISQLTGVDRLLMILATLAYLFAVQLPTFTINVPLNNKLQTLDVDQLDEAAQKEVRMEFEPRWLLWNSIRTFIAILVSALLMILLLRL